VAAAHEHQNDQDEENLTQPERRDIAQFPHADPVDTLTLGRGSVTASEIRLGARIGGALE
jgi:hypothetical protein